MTKTVRWAIWALPIAAVIVVLITYLFLNGIAAGAFITMATIIVPIVWAIVVIVLGICHRAECDFWKMAIQIFWSLCVTVAGFLITIMVVMRLCS